MAISVVKKERVGKHSVKNGDGKMGESKGEDGEGRKRKEIERERNPSEKVEILCARLDRLVHPLEPSSEKPREAQDAPELRHMGGTLIEARLVR